jgi:hypothetical protein
VATVQAVAKSAATPPVASVTVVAEIPLTASGPDELAVKAEQLQRRMKAADLPGVKTLGARAQDLDIPQCGTCKTAPGEPALSFVARFTPEERKRALAEAFAAARAEAELLAGASGLAIGRLTHLSDQPRPTAPPESAPLSPLARPAPTAQRTDEAVSAKPERLTYRATVSASFTLLGGTARPR